MDINAILALIFAVMAALFSMILYIRENQYFSIINDLKHVIDEWTKTIELNSDMVNLNRQIIDSLEKCLNEKED